MRLDGLLGMKLQADGFDKSVATFRGSFSFRPWQHCQHGPTFRRQRISLAPLKKRRSIREIAPQWNEKTLPPLRQCFSYHEDPRYVLATFEAIPGCLSTVDLFTPPIPSHSRVRASFLVVVLPRCDVVM